MPKSQSVQEVLPSNPLIPNNPNKFRRKIVKKIIKKRILENPKTGETQPIGKRRDVSPDFKERVQFDVITTKYERDGSTSMKRTETYRENPPKVLKELKVSMRQLD